MSGPVTVLDGATYKEISKNIPLPTQELLLGASVGDAGTVTAPAAGAAIVSIASGSLPAGEYRVRVKAGYGGSASTVNNMELRKGATVITDLAVLALANNLQDHLLDRVTLDGTQALSVNATAAGAAGTIFIAEIIATRIA